MMNNTLINLLNQFKNPKTAVLNMLNNNTNPIIKNLVKMAENGDIEGVETFARNLYKQQGRDFDSELSQFKSMFK